MKVAYLSNVTLLPGAISVDAKAPAAARQEAQRFINFRALRSGSDQMQTGDPMERLALLAGRPRDEPAERFDATAQISSQHIDPCPP